MKTYQQEQESKEVFLQEFVKFDERLAFVSVTIRVECPHCRKVYGISITKGYLPRKMLVCRDCNNSII